MTRVVFVGEMYNADLSVGGGPIIPAPQPPLGIWGPTDPRPTHPIAGYPWPQPPTGQPPYPSQGLPPFATNLPVVPPGGVWPTPPGQPPYPDAGLPPFATNLPVVPPGGAWPTPPGGGGGQPPLGIWGGPYFPPVPSHPIVLPPDLPPTMPDPDNRPIEWKTGWTQATGWVIYGVPTGPAPTPSST